MDAMTNTANLTADTITDADIRELRDDAYQADLHKTVSYSNIALGIVPATDFVKRDARQICADAINAARAAGGR